MYCTFTNIILRVFTEKILNDHQQMFCIQYLTLLNHYFDHLTHHWSHLKIPGCWTTTYLSCTVNDLSQSAILN